MAAIPLVGRSAILESLGVFLQRGKSVLLVGPAGVGKSRLLNELLRPHFGRDCHVERFAGTVAGQQIRFGSLISMVDRYTSDVSQQLAEIRSALLARAADRSLVVAVDDLHLLDEASIACIADLVNRGDAILWATVRAGDEIPETVTALWTGGAVERMDIGPLDDEATAAMATAILGGPVDRELVNEIIERSENNPLFVREMILDGRATASICFDGKQWSLVSPLAAGPRLTEVARARTGPLSEQETDALEMIAFGEPLDMEALPPEAQATIDRLERAGLARTELETHRVRVRCDHPLIGEAIRLDTPVGRRVDVLGRLVAGYERIGTPQPGDALRVAGWGAEIGRPVSPSILNGAARDAIASLDFELALSLARDAAERDGTCDHFVTLGDVHRIMAQPADADLCFLRALEVARSEADDALVTRRRALLHTHQLGRPDLAVRIAAAGAQRLHDPRLIVELEQIATDFSGMLGRYDEVLRASTRLLRHDDGRDPATRRAGLNNLVYAQVMLGQLDEIDQRINECMAFERAATDRGEWTEVLWALRTGVFIQRGQLEEGERTLSQRVNERNGDNPVGLAATMRLQLLLYRASPAIFDLITATIAELRRADPFGALPIAASLSAYAIAQTGRLPEAMDMLRLVPDDSADVRTRPFAARGRAAVLAMQGEVNQAADVVIDAGRATISASHVVFGVTTLHDAVRFGRAADVADEMASSTQDSNGPFTKLMVADAVASRDGNGPALARIGTAFHDYGAPVMAADALARASRFLDPDSPEARLVDTQLSLLARSVQPFLVPTGALPVDGLTVRELDIAAAARGASTSREIAEAQFISVRTVDNHLRQVYRKLGLHGRTELTTALGSMVSPQGESVSRS